MIARSPSRAGWLLAAIVLAGGALVTRERLRAESAADSSPRLDPLLTRTASVVERSLQQLSDVACKENVVQERFGRNGKVEYEERALFDYVVLFQSQSGEPVMAESRLAKSDSGKQKNVPLLLTNGFSTMMLIFHPYYSGGFQFTDLGEEVVGGQEVEKVHFQHVKGLRSTTALMLGSREYPLDLQGIALIEVKTGEILKIEASLEGAMDDLGLKEFHSEVDYGPLRFPGVPEAYWLPTTAAIDVQSIHQHWRNIHHFSEYHRFETSVKETIGSTP